GEGGALASGAARAAVVERASPPQRAARARLHDRRDRIADRADLHRRRDEDDRALAAAADGGTLRQPDRPARLSCRSVRTARQLPLALDIFGRVGAALGVTPAQPSMLNVEPSALSPRP